MARPDKQTHSAEAASRVIVEPLVHLIEEDTCPQAWLKAVEYLSGNHDATYNLVLAVRRPEVLRPADFAIHDRVDAFLREYDRPSLATIAGTIFPANLYLHGGAEELYTYPQIYPRIPSQWGTYAIRMLRKSTSRRGNGQAEINPLKIIVAKMKKQLPAVACGRYTKPIWSRTPITSSYRSMMRSAMRGGRAASRV